eukprot:6850731-Pyramimonas_sp.AAC.1
MMTRTWFRDSRSGSRPISELSIQQTNKPDDPQSISVTMSSVAALTARVQYRKPRASAKMAQMNRFADLARLADR